MPEQEIGNGIAVASQTWLWAGLAPPRELAPPTTMAANLTCLSHTAPLAVTLDACCNAIDHLINAGTRNWKWNRCCFANLASGLAPPRELAPPTTMAANLTCLSHTAPLAVTLDACCNAIDHLINAGTRNWKWNRCCFKLGLAGLAPPRELAPPTTMAANLTCLSHTAPLAVTLDACCNAIDHLINAGTRNWNGIAVASKLGLGWARPSPRARPSHHNGCQFDMSESHSSTCSDIGCMLQCN